MAGGKVMNYTKRLYNLKEAAHWLGRPVHGLRDMIYAGEIPYLQRCRGAKIYIDIEDLIHYVNREKRAVRF
jgi:hypothetical protein